MDRWEYTDLRVSSTLNSIRRHLRRMGEEGWEAWHAKSQSDGTTILFFKRKRER